MTTKHKKYTILRAPCNHKNSKEQFGFTTYKAKLIKNCSFRQNKFYNEFIVLSFFYTKYDRFNWTKFEISTNECIIII